MARLLTLDELAALPRRVRYGDDFSGEDAEFLAYAGRGDSPTAAAMAAVPAAQRQLAERMRGNLSGVYSPHNMRLLGRVYLAGRVPATDADLNAITRAVARYLDGKAPGTRDKSGLFAVPSESTFERIAKAVIVGGAALVAGFTVAGAVSGAGSSAAAGGAGVGAAPAAAPVELLSGMDALGGLGTADAAAVGLGGVTAPAPLISVGTVASGAGALKTAVAPFLGLGQAVRSLVGGDAPAGSPVPPLVVGQSDPGVMNDLLWAVGAIAAVVLMVKLAKG